MKCGNCFSSSLQCGMHAWKASVPSLDPFAYIRRCPCLGIFRIEAVGVLAAKEPRRALPPGAESSARQQSSSRSPFDNRRPTSTSATNPRLKPKSQCRTLDSRQYSAVVRIPNPLYPRRRQGRRVDEHRSEARVRVRGRDSPVICEERLGGRVDV